MYRKYFNGNDTVMSDSLSDIETPGECETDWHIESSVQTTHTHTYK